MSDYSKNHENRVTTIRKFETGATRSPLGDKLQYEGFLSPLVIKRYAEYMHKHRFQSDGQVRDPDNWQKGMPRDSYIDSGWRHLMDWWLHHRGHSFETTESIEDSLCALIFNASGYLHSLLVDKDQLDAEKCVSNWVATQPASTIDRSKTTLSYDEYLREHRRLTNVPRGL